MSLSGQLFVPTRNFKEAAATEKDSFVDVLVTHVVNPEEIFLHKVCLLQLWNSFDGFRATNLCARLAQLVRSLTANLEVASSIPGQVEG